MEVCRECNKMIEDEFVLAVGSSFLHQECLRCSVCCDQLSDSCFSKFDQFYCKKDFYKMFGPKCGACHLVFAETDKVCSIGQSQFHVDCFSCSKCHLNLEKGMRVGIDPFGYLFCEEDFIKTIEESKEETKETINFDEKNITIKLENKENDAIINPENIKPEPSHDMDQPMSPNCDSGSEDDSKDDKKEGKDGKRRGPRTTIKAKQLEVLKTMFDQSPKPTRVMREQLAKDTGLSMRVIQVWFQNKRSKEKRMHQLRYMANGTPFFHRRPLHPMAFPPNAIAYDFRGPFQQEFPQDFAPFPHSFTQEDHCDNSDPHHPFPSPPHHPQDFPSPQDFPTEPCFPSPPLSDYSPPEYHLPHLNESMVC